MELSSFSARSGQIVGEDEVAAFERILGGGERKKPAAAGERTRRTA